MGDGAEAPLLQDKDKDALKEVDKPQVGTFTTLVHLMASDASLLFVAFCAGMPCRASPCVVKDSLQGFPGPASLPLKVASGQGSSLCRCAAVPVLAVQPAGSKSICIVQRRLVLQGPAGWRCFYQDINTSLQKPSACVQAVRLGQAWPQQACMHTCSTAVAACTTKHAAHLRPCAQHSVRRLKHALSGPEAHDYPAQCHAT